MVLVVMDSSVVSVRRAKVQQKQTRKAEAGSDARKPKRMKWRRRKLVATEQAGTQSRRQVRPIPPRTNQAMQPALGPGRVGRIRQTRIGILAQHREPSTSLPDYSFNAGIGVTPLGSNEWSRGGNPVTARPRVEAACRDQLRCLAGQSLAADQDIASNLSATFSNFLVSC